MTRTRLLLAAAFTCLMLSGTAVFAETGRIKRQVPDASNAARIASDIAMNDGLLQKGDIVVTDRGFLVFRGVASDGYTYQFSPVPHPGLIDRPAR